VSQTAYCNNEICNKSENFELTSPADFSLSTNPFLHAQTVLQNINAEVPTLMVDGAASIEDKQTAHYCMCLSIMRDSGLFTGMLYHLPASLGLRITSCVWVIRVWVMACVRVSNIASLDSWTFRPLTQNYQCFSFHIMRNLNYMGIDGSVSHPLGHSGSGSNASTGLRLLRLACRSKIPLQIRLQ
jgi:hypothetical protein